MYPNYSRTICEAALATAMIASLDLEPAPAFSLPNLPLASII